MAPFISVSSYLSLAWSWTLLLLPAGDEPGLFGPVLDFVLVLDDVVGLLGLHFRAAQLLLLLLLLLHLFDVVGHFLDLAPLLPD